MIFATTPQETLDHITRKSCEFMKTLGRSEGGLTTGLQWPANWRMTCGRRNLIFGSPGAFTTICCQTPQTPSTGQVEYKLVALNTSFHYRGGAVFKNGFVIGP